MLLHQCDYHSSWVIRGTTSRHTQTDPPIADVTLTAKEKKLRWSLDFRIETIVKPHYSHVMWWCEIKNSLFLLLPTLPSSIIDTREIGLGV